MKQRTPQFEVERGGKRHAVIKNTRRSGFLGLSYCGLYVGKHDTFYKKAHSTSINCKRCLASIARLERRGLI